VEVVQLEGARDISLLQTSDLEFLVQLQPLDLAREHGHAVSLTRVARSSVRSRVQVVIAPATFSDEREVHRVEVHGGHSCPAVCSLLYGCRSCCIVVHLPCLCTVLDILLTHRVFNDLGERLELLRELFAQELEEEYLFEGDLELDQGHGDISNLEVPLRVELLLEGDVRGVEEHDAIFLRLLLADERRCEQLCQTHPSLVKEHCQLCQLCVHLRIWLQAGTHRSVFLAAFIRRCGSRFSSSWGIRILKCSSGVHTSGIRR